MIISSLNLEPGGGKKRWVSFALMGSITALYMHPGARPGPGVCTYSHSGSVFLLAHLGNYVIYRVVFLIPRLLRR